MNGFPKIKGLRWLCEDFPDLVAIDITLEDRKYREMDIKGFKIPETPGLMYVDLSKLAGAHEWYPPGCDEPSQKECTLEVDGIDTFIANMNIKDVIDAWTFCKRFKYSKK